MQKENGATPIALTALSLARFRPDFPTISFKEIHFSTQKNEKCKNESRNDAEF